MNPEFRRQLWLQFSPNRLALMPALLLACFAAVALSADQARGSALAMAGATLFVVLVWGMGTLAAGASVIDEITERTWDQQRLSAMQPWAMTWGKLAGASAYGWYGGAMCLLVAVPSAVLGEYRAQLGLKVLGAVLVGIFLPAMLIAVNLQLVKLGGRVVRRGGVWALLVVVWSAIGPLMTTMGGPDVTWWNHTFGSMGFTVASVACFTVCALVAAWRSMAEVLCVRQLPWGWPALALIATLYATGFATGHHAQFFGLFGMASCMALTYAALLTEPQTRPLWQRVVTRLVNQQWRAALQQLPLWPGTLALALPCAAWVMLTMDTQAITHDDWIKQLQWHPLCIVLLAVRDCALALYFAFAPNSKRPLMAFLVAMLVLWGLLPWLMGAMGGKLLLGLAQPLMAGSGLATVVAAAHAAAALALLRTRWVATAP